MTPDEFFDKEHGTTRALTRLPLSDSARNELASGDPGPDTDEVCPDCEGQLVEQTREGDEPYACLDCGWEGEP